MHGWAFVARRMSQLQNLGEFEIRIGKLRGNLGNTASEAQKLAADQAMKRVGDAVEATVRGGANNPGPSIRSVDDAISNIDRVPTSHLRALTTPHIGPGKAFATVEEFEAMRVLPVQSLDEAQRNALRAIREGVIQIGSGTPLTKYIKFGGEFGAFDMLLNGRATITGSVARTQDVAGLNGSKAVIDRLRLDFPGSGFAEGLPTARIETIATPSMANSAKIPTNIDPVPPGWTKVLPPDDQSPFTGHGLTGSLDGHLTPESKLTTLETMLPDVTIMRLRNPDGSPFMYTINGLTASDWVMRRNDFAPSGYAWEPLP